MRGVKFRPDGQCQFVSDDMWRAIIARAFWHIDNGKCLPRVIGFEMELDPIGLTGSDTPLIGRTAEPLMTCEADGRCEANFGDCVRFAIDEAHLHFCDEATGRRIEAEQLAQAS